MPVGNRGGRLREMGVLPGGVGVLWRAVGGLTVLAADMGMG